MTAMMSLWQQIKPLSAYEPDNAPDGGLYALGSPLDVPEPPGQVMPGVLPG